MNSGRRTGLVGVTFERKGGTMSTDLQSAVAELKPLIGDWIVEVSIAPPGVHATCSFEPVLGGAFVVQRSEVPDPAPSSLCVLAPNEDGDGYTQHYFDSRGVVRVYAMTLENGVWTLERTKADFTPLSFAQRYRGTFTDDGNAIAGAWESRQEGADWQLDFELTYRRA
jgi:hypothetical protein